MNSRNFALPVYQDTTQKYQYLSTSMYYVRNWLELDTQTISAISTISLSNRNKIAIMFGIEEEEEETQQ